MLNKSSVPDGKSDILHTEQIDSPSISKNLDNYDRDSEEWEELSNKELGQSRKLSPANETAKGVQLKSDRSVNIKSPIPSQ